MNLGTTCVFDHMEMCCPRILYVVHFTEQLTLEEARTKMTEITGTDFSEGAYFSVGLDFVDCTLLYHLIQLGVESDEVKEGIKILKNYRPQILENVTAGRPSNPLMIRMYDEDARDYEWQNKFHERIKVAMDEGYAELRKRSEEYREKRRLERESKTTD
ncbi:hypothetical protein DS691_21110 [Salmonella enterica subsp. enterica serovar Bareilly]|nr:hypothetical protein [Salmonella enterica subsp. enterica serovar Bareilly]